jgi:hypothetical protein
MLRPRFEPNNNRIRVKSITATQTPRFACKCYSLLEIMTWTFVDLYQNVDFEVPTVLIYSFWDKMSCSSLKLSRHFGGTCRLYLQGRRISQASSKLCFLWKFLWFSTDYTALYPRRFNSYTRASEEADFLSVVKVKTAIILLNICLYVPNYTENILQDHNMGLLGCELNTNKIRIGSTNSPRSAVKDVEGSIRYNFWLPCVVTNNCPILSCFDPLIHKQKQIFTALLVKSVFIYVRASWRGETEDLQFKS